MAYMLNTTGLLCHGLRRVSQSSSIFKCPHSITKHQRLQQFHCVSATSAGVHRQYSSSSDLPQETKVVVCGGGIIGASVAYHLALNGWTDVVVLEQGSLTCGTTWHSVGLVGRLRGTSLEASIVNYSSKLYQELQDEGYGTGWKQCGSVNVARTRDRLISYKRALNLAEQQGVKGEVLSPSEIKAKVPLLKTDDLEGGVWIPEDGVVSAPDVCMALANKGKTMGVQIYEKTKVLNVLTDDDNKVRGVETDKGTIQCQYFVNCCGQWAHELGLTGDRSSHVRIPLHPCEHFYLVTKPIEGVDRMMPVVRDYDGFVYLREWSGGILGGGFEDRGKPVFHNGIPDKFEFQLLPEDWDHFQILLEQLLHRVPELANAEVKQLTNGPESFTPDGKYIIGETPEVKNYFVAAGMNSSGIAAAGGIGKIIAEWMIEGEPTVNVWGMDVRRFVDLHNNKKFLRDRVSETLGASVHIKFWDSFMVGTTTGRRLRASPLFARSMEGKAVFGQSMGYERPLYFESLIDEDDDWYTRSPANVTDTNDYFDSGFVEQSAFAKPQWFDQVKAEYWACREGVCVIDMSTFTKFELRSAGDEVVDFLQYVCSNDVDQNVGTVIHTGMQNHHGGYENDCSIIRMADSNYFMIGPTAQQTRSFAWLNKHLPKDGSVQLSDVTSMYTAINVIGPKAQELLSELTDQSLSKQDFPLMTCQEINVAQASNIKAMRLTHSGEDGWMLYIPSEYALHVYDSLMAVGKNYGIKNAGYYALRALRTEKFFAYWGTDLTPQTTPMECGRAFRVKLDRYNGRFIGDEALRKQQQEGIKKRLIQFLLEDHDLDNDLWPWGGEPIYRNGKFCGITSSTAYGFTLDRHVCLGYVHNINSNGEQEFINNDFILKNAQFEIDIAGRRFPAKANIYPPKLASAALIIDSGNRKM